MVNGRRHGFQIVRPPIDHMEEKALIPFDTSELPTGPWLVFAPHPDDETFGMGGSLILAREAGIEVHIVVMTDGSAGGDERARNTSSIREEEALRVCGSLDVTGCYFWRKKDRRLDLTDELCRRAIELITSIGPKSIFIPSCLELHPDHRTTSAIVWKALQDTHDFSGVLFTYDIGTQGPVNKFIDITGVMKEKRSLMSLYASQVDTNRYIELVESLDRARTYTLPDRCKAAEGFYATHVIPGVTIEQMMGRWFMKYFQSRDWLRMPLVSVIVRTRNRLEMLKEALASIASQKYPNIEVIVVNDGGERVGSLLRNLDYAFIRLKCVEFDTTLGRSAAANRGMDHVKGDYFMFLDDDDWMDSTHISNLVYGHLTDDNNLVVYTGIQAVDTASGSNSPGYVFNEPFDRYRLYYENYIPIHAALIKRTAIDNGYRFDESLELLEDWDYWLRLCQVTVAFRHVDAVTGYYRMSGAHGQGFKKGDHRARRKIYARWSKTWGIDEIDELLTRLSISTKNKG